MARIRISELLNNGANFLGEKIEIKGWVRAFRSKRFVQLNDGSCMANIQGVIDYDNFDEALSNLESIIGQSNKDFKHQDFSLEAQSIKHKNLLKKLI